MQRTRSALLHVLVRSVLVLFCAAPMACKKAAPPALAPADQTYTVRARLIGKPSEASYLQLHHEVIPNFQNKEGTVVGMKEMTMEFADLSGAASDALASLAEGDPVEVIFEVRWNSEPRTLVTSVRKLPQDQAPTFGKPTGPE